MASSTGGFSQHRPMFPLATDRKEFVVDTMEPRHVFFLQVLLFFPANFHSTNAPDSFLYQSGGRNNITPHHPHQE